MPQFRKRPVVIEATQWFPGTHVEGVCLYDVVDHIGCTGLPHIHTLEGVMHVSAGDFIITGVKGERYACKPDVFALTYEPAAMTGERSDAPQAPSELEELKADRSRVNALLNQMQKVIDRKAGGVTAELLKLIREERG